MSILLLSMNIEVKLLGRKVRSAELYRFAHVPVMRESSSFLHPCRSLLMSVAFLLTICWMCSNELIVLFPDEL